MMKNYYLKPCPFCGCSDVSMYTNGSDLDNYSYVVECDGCGCTLDTGWQTEEKAAEEWNLRKERTAKVIEHDASIMDDRGYKYQRSEYLCDACKKKVIGGDDYCSHCGCKLVWNVD